MIKTIENIGIGPRMVGWIKVLNNHPTASVEINGSLLPPFEMLNGTRQGCPLSPLLFVLTFEPLLATIRNNVDIRWVKIRGQEHKVTAYDVLCYVTNPRITLSNQKNTENYLI